MTPAQQPPPDLAGHFFECGKVGRYLTFADESRFVITDDFKSGGVRLAPTAAAAASVFSRDPLVAQAALVPLGLRALRSGDARRQDRFAELFDLIEHQALEPEIRSQAGQILVSGFRESQIRAIEEELGGKITPARRRYRAFLDVVRRLVAGDIEAQDFRDEFAAFTQAVAGKLDFGVYSFCLDRIFSNSRVPLKAKAYLLSEIMGFPPLVRRELVTNILSLPGQSREIIDLTKAVIEREMDSELVVETYLLVTLKTSKLSVGQMQDMFLGQTPAPANLAAFAGAAAPN
ncbi:MAG: hypothetical protein ACYYKD_07330 [Rhodospirillales bacterium]